MSITVPSLGHGVGLRPAHYQDALRAPRVDWFEVVSENFMVPGGRPLEMLRRAREARPIVLHGVSLSLGAVDPLREDYVTDLARLAERFEPAWISDHLCWGSHDGAYAHDLLPLPYTGEALAHVAERIRRVQDRLGQQILIENVSSYVTFAHSAMPEWEFLTAVAEAADCGILLDVNNVWVSAVNHGFDPYAYVSAVPVARVGQVHLAGHTVHETHLLDTHDHPVCDEVWALYAHAVRRFGPISTLIEWDDRLPSYDDLVAESDRARAVERDALAQADALAG